MLLFSVHNTNLISIHWISSDIIGVIFNHSRLQLLYFIRRVILILIICVFLVCLVKYTLWICVSTAQSFLILCNAMDCSPPGSSVHGMHQARILGWVAIPFSRVSSWPMNWTQVSCIAGRFFTVWDLRANPSCLHCFQTFFFFNVWKFMFKFSMSAHLC